MDTLTHALSGALLARATARTELARATARTELAGATAHPKLAHADRAAAAPTGELSMRARVAVGFLVAAFPDLDVMLTWVSPITYLTQHRGVTHSIILLPLWALLLAFVFSHLNRGGPGWRAYVGVCALSIGIHIAGDWITSFGTMMLAPFSDARFALSSTFIIDLIFTGIIIIGLLGSALWRASRLPAVLGLAALAGYVAFQSLQHERAFELAERYAGAKGYAGYRVAALPRPVSPFNWTVFITEGERYHIADINLVRLTVSKPVSADDNFFRRLSAPYRPLHDPGWRTERKFAARSASDIALAREAWSQPGFAFYRWFAAFPALDAVTRGNPETCVWFRDLRFDMPGRRTSLFDYGLCREPAGVQNNAPWRGYKREADGSKQLIR